MGDIDADDGEIDLGGESGSSDEDTDIGFGEGQDVTVVIKDFSTKRPTFLPPNRVF